MVPLLSFEILVNVSILTSIPITHSNDELQVYLTSLFLIPLRRKYLRSLLMQQTLIIVSNLRTLFIQAQHEHYSTNRCLANLYR